MELTLLHYKLLVMEFPLLRGFISSCYSRGTHNELIDFIFALETDNEPRSH